MSGGFDEAAGKAVVERMIAVIHVNRAYLSEIDGAIGDGDHGINMDKGFSLAGKRLEGQSAGMSESLKLLGDVLVDEIGGSMGPLYGTFFKRMARASKGVGRVDVGVLDAMLDGALQGVLSIGEARAGDKTLLDTLEPARDAVRQAREQGGDLVFAVDAMLKAAYDGWQSTKDLVARVGRASRLGERSRGTLDAGATSCYLILEALGDAVKDLAK